MSTSTPRTAEQIEAELEFARADLAETVNQLAYELTPSTQINRAKQAASEKVRDVSDYVRAVAGDLANRSRLALEDGVKTAKETCAQARKGNRDAIIRIGVAAASTITAGLIFRKVRHHRRTKKA